MDFNAVLRARLDRETVHAHDVVEVLLNMLAHHALLMGMPLDELLANVSGAYATHANDRVAGRGRADG